MLINKLPINNPERAKCDITEVIIWKNNVNLKILSKLKEKVRVNPFVICMNVLLINVVVIINKGKKTNKNNMYVALLSNK